MDKLITVDRVSYEVKGKTILKDITLEIPKGKIISILGNNGSGKSTLLGILLDDFKPSEGSVIYHPGKQQVLSDVGVLYSNQLLFPLLTVKEIIQYFSSIYKLEDKDYSHIIDLFDLRKLESRQIKALSEGERMKLSVLLAVFHRPSLLVMDEPFAGVDPTITDTVWKVIQEYGMTILLTSHNWEIANKVSDTIAFLHEGELVCPAFTSEEYNKLLPAERKVVLSDTDGVPDLISAKDYYAHDGFINVFLRNNDLLQEIQKVTYNYSILDTTLKDAYLFSVNKKVA
jgi:ABC-type multidrug transport system ATPase subunit